MPKPNFFCIGTQKAGTTSLHYILNQHPDIYLPDMKEIHFFDRDENYNKGTEWYLDFYKEVKNEKIIGEINPNYIYDKNTPQRLYDFDKNLKLIVILRNPADRAFSNYKMIVGRNEEKNSFKKAVKIDLQRIENKENYPFPYHYINRGYYYYQIQRYLKLFPPQNMLFILFEKDFLQDRKQTIDKIYNFLNIKKENISVNIKLTPQTHHKSKKADKILNTSNPFNQFAKKLIPSKKLRTNIKYFFTKINQKPTVDKSELEEMRPFLINEIYKDSILELEKLIDRDLSNWLKL